MQQYIAQYAAVFYGILQYMKSPQKHFMNAKSETKSNIAI